MEIYLDMNIIVSYIKQENENIIKTINFLSKNTKYKLPYSPAHIEEIAVIKRKVTTQKSEIYINRNLRIISKIAKNYEYLPTKNDGIIKKIELVKECYIRVMKNYNYTTIIAEKIEENKVNKWASIKLGIDKNDLNKINPKEIFIKKEILILLKEYLINSLQRIIPEHKRNGYSNLFHLSLLVEKGIIPKGRDIINNHHVLELLIELIFNFLNDIGYKNDKQPIKKEKYRSGMHDISHGIYASQSNFFVTDDEYFKNKLTAIYSLLEIKTVIISSQDFSILVNDNSQNIKEK
jgi:hypothetical protein